MNRCDAEQIIFDVPCARGATLVFSQQEAFKYKVEFGVTVQDDYQNLVFGTILIELTVDIALWRVLKKISLVVIKENHRAIKVYEKCSFRIEGMLKKNHYNFLTEDYGAIT